MPITKQKTRKKTDFQKVRVYTLAREVDSDTRTFEKALATLKREFGFDKETETFHVDDL